MRASPRTLTSASMAVDTPNPCRQVPRLGRYPYWTDASPPAGKPETTPWAVARIPTQKLRFFLCVESDEDASDEVITTAENDPAPFSYVQPSTLAHARTQTARTSPGSSIFRRPVRCGAHSGAPRFSDPVRHDSATFASANSTTRPLYLPCLTLCTSPPRNALGDEPRQSRWP